MTENNHHRPILIASFSGVSASRPRFMHYDRRLLQNQTAINIVDLLRGSRQSKRMRLKLKRRRQMLGKVLPIMPAGIKMKLVRDPARRQQLVELHAALV